jgi:hypothetical protein
MFAKLEAAYAKGTPWVATLAGQLGPATATGFVLIETNLQVFDVKPKPHTNTPPAPTAP